MKRRQYMGVVVVLLLISLQAMAVPEADQPAAVSYYEQLRSLTVRRNSSRIRLKAAERDINLIEIDKGAGGVLFGATMDEVVAVWGKPGGLSIEQMMSVWDLRVGACRFGFVGNRLVRISLHSATLDTAHFANGIGFESTYDQIKATFGEPIEAEYCTLKFATEDGYTAEFHFVPDASLSGQRELINIEICHPDGVSRVGRTMAKFYGRRLRFWLTQNSSQEAKPMTSGTYYERLTSLMTKRDSLEVRPKSSERDINLIEIEKGAAGVPFGASMDDVMAIWGKPNGLFIDMRPTWDLRIGACKFGFLEGRLVTISVSGITLKEAHLPNGIDFRSSYNEVRAAFGDLIEADDSRLEFVTDNGYVVKFLFITDKRLAAKHRIASIEICHPDSGQ